MLLALAGAAFLMGVAGGPHCAAMCGPACSGVIRIVRPGAAAQASGTLEFHGGRLLGYALAGAAAAQAVSSVAWLGNHTSALRPVWTLFHVAVLAWGLTLLVWGRQPAAVSSAGRQVWSRVRPLATQPGGAFFAGLLWTFMPCGLLYSALLVAALSGGPAEGALAMALFAVGSAASLALAPRLLQRLRVSGDRWGRNAGTRVSGLVLALTAVSALWLDLFHRIAVWCGLA